MIVSAGNYFRPGGDYVFDPRGVEEAHAICLRDFAHRVQGMPKGFVFVLRGIPGSGKSAWAKANDGPDKLIVDNTNATVAELAPYCALALAFEHQLQIRTFIVTPEQAMARQSKNIPVPKLIVMAGQVLRETRHIPSRWLQVTVEAGT